MQIYNTSVHVQQNENNLFKQTIKSKSSMKNVEPIPFLSANIGK